MTAHAEGQGLCASLLGSCAPVLCNHKTDSKTYLHTQLKNHIYPDQKSMGTSSQTLQDRGPGLQKVKVCRPLGSSTPSKLS